MIFFGARLENILAELPRSVRERLRHVTIHYRRQPNALDIERGALPTTRGYFYGLAPEQLEGETTALPETAPPRGEIVLFSGRISDRLELARVLLHEIAHALGFDHDVIEGELCL